MEAIAFLKFIPEIYAIFKVIAANYQDVIASVLMVCSAISGLIVVLVPLFMAIPGEHPEKELNFVSEKIKVFVAFISKYSKK